MVGAPTYETRLLRSNHCWVFNDVAHRIWDGVVPCSCCCTVVFCSPFPLGSRGWNVLTPGCFDGDKVQLSGRIQTVSSAGVCKLRVLLLWAEWVRLRWVSSPLCFNLQELRTQHAQHRRYIRWGESIYLVAGISWILWWLLYFIVDRHLLVSRAHLAQQHDSLEDSNIRTLFGCDLGAACWRQKGSTPSNPSYRYLVYVYTTIRNTPIYIIHIYQVWNKYVRKSVLLKNCNRWEYYY